MKLNSKNQLGLLISENHDLQLRIIAHQTGNIKKRAEFLSEDELYGGIAHTSELILDDGKYLNKNYAVRATALEMAKKIPVDTPKFDIKFLKNLPHKKATFLLGAELAMKYYKTEDNVYAVFFRHENTPQGLALTWTWLRINLITGEILLPPRQSPNEVVGNDQIGFINNPEPYSDSEFRLFVQLLLFVELSELTLELLKPKQKTGTRKTGKYINESRKDVTIVDSKWNVVSVNNEGFLVNGHWRMQPYGQNREQRKMIWIDTFEKKGYIRRHNRVTNPNLQNNG